MTRILDVKYMKKYGSEPKLVQTIKQEKTNN